VKLIGDQDILIYEKNRMVIPTAQMQKCVVDWYHHYLLHLGTNRVKETITIVMWWPKMAAHIRKHVKVCDRYQKGKNHKQKYGKIPPKIVKVI
jgi:hypothetical protein